MKYFALQVIKFVNSLPKNESTSVIRKQLIRSGTSTAANYRAACRARSRADFISKMKIVEEEADESICWMELLIDSKMVVDNNTVNNLIHEANELLSITVSSIKTAKYNN